MTSSTARVAQPLGRHNLLTCILLCAAGEHVQALVHFDAQHTEIWCVAGSESYSMGGSVCLSIPK